jgi:hypothetical protein
MSIPQKGASDIETNRLRVPYWNQRTDEDFSEAIIDVPQLAMNLLPRIRTQARRISDLI